MSEPRYAHRLPPCPAYDVEGMESWLGELAGEGLLLAPDGFFAGVGTFERTEPRTVRYRLEAAQKSTSMWADDGGDPDPEQVALGRAYTWDYVAKRGDFYIYRTFDPQARELNTDPQVQALALEAVKKRRWGAVSSVLFWAVLYPLAMLRGGVLLTVIDMGTWLFLLTAGFVLWMLADAVHELVWLGRLQKRLRAGDVLTRRKDWRKRSALYHWKNAAQIILALVLVGIFLHKWSVSAMNKDKVQLDQYTGTLPFASMSELAGGEVSDLEMTMMGLSLGFNSIEEKSDWLAPRCIHYMEHSRLTLSDGRVLDGGLYVDYYEAASPWVARQLARESYRLDRLDQHGKHFKPINPPELDAEFLRAYSSSLHFPTLLLQDGRVVLRAYFYQTSQFTLDFDEWAKVMGESVLDQAEQ